MAGGLGTAPPDTPWPQTQPPAQVHSRACDGQYLRSAQTHAPPSPPPPAQSHAHYTLSTRTATLNTCSSAHTSAHVGPTHRRAHYHTYAVTYYHPYPRALGLSRPSSGDSKGQKPFVGPSGWSGLARWSSLRDHCVSAAGGGGGRPVPGRGLRRDCEGQEGMRLASARKPVKMGHALPLGAARAPSGPL